MARANVSRLIQMLRLSSARHLQTETPDNPGVDQRGLAVTALSLVVNLILGMVKCVVGWMAGSRALLVDGLHSLSDLSSDLAVLFAIFYAPKPSDTEHNYGHQKVTSLVSFFISLLILVFCVGVFFDAILALQKGDIRTPSIIAFYVAVASLLLKELLFFVTMRVARRTGSRLLSTNAWHHRTDSISSLAAMAGIGGAVWLGSGWAFLDALVGIILACFLAFAGGSLFRDAWRDLMDAAPEPKMIDDIREHILPTPGVVAYHDFRIRRSGDNFVVDLHLQVDDNCTVKEGHSIASKVEERILARHPNVADVLVHVEPALHGNHAQKAKGIHGSNLPAHSPLGDFPLPPASP
jgi:cation diffusion facilitator family transporter